MNCALLFLKNKTFVSLSQNNDRQETFVSILQELKNIFEKKHEEIIN